MRSYNIAIFTETQCSLDYEMGTSPLRALKRIGKHNIIPIDHKALYKLHGPSKIIEITKELLRENKVEIVIFGLEGEYEFPIEYFSGLREHYFMVLHVGDDEHYFDKSSRYYSQAFDLIMTQTRLSMGRFEMYGVDSILLPPAFDISGIKNLHYEKTYDVSFIGVIINKIGRKDYLNFLIENNIDIKIFGFGTSGGVVSRNEMCRVSGSSKIGLNFTGLATNNCLDSDITINRRMKQPKVRAHEIALMNTFVLAEYVPGIEEFFDIGEEIDIFHDKNELLEKVKYYLEHDLKREEMAAKGFERALLDCDEVVVWEKLLAEIGDKMEMKNNEKVEREDIIYKDPIFKRAFSSFHFSKMWEFMLQGELGKAVDEFKVFIKYPLLDWGVFLFYVQRYLASIGWLRRMVQKLKGKLRGNNVSKV